MCCRPTLNVIPAHAFQHLLEILTHVTSRHSENTLQSFRVRAFIFKIIETTYCMKILFMQPNHCCSSNYREGTKHSLSNSHFDCCFRTQPIKMHIYAVARDWKRASAIKRDNVCTQERARGVLFRSLRVACKAPAEPPPAHGNWLRPLPWANPFSQDWQCSNRGW